LKKLFYNQTNGYYDFLAWKNVQKFTGHNILTIFYNKFLNKFSIYLSLFLVRTFGLIGD